MALDHDGIFKQLLSSFLGDFLDLFAPELLAMLEPDRLTLLATESFVDLLDPDRRTADLLVQAQVRGEPATILIHLEHQAQEDRTLDRRMFRYFARFYDRYDQVIYPVALCSYPTPQRGATSAHRLAV
jgi:predicted transposase/invertase (TIGR01784 family)